MENAHTAHYDTPRPLSKPKDTDKPVFALGNVTAVDHQLATNEKLQTEDDEEYVPPIDLENQHALLGGMHRNEDQQYPSLASPWPPAEYAELIGQRPPSSIYTLPTKIPADN